MSPRRPFARVSRTPNTGWALYGLRVCNRHLPLLRTHDRFGHRIDEVEFHPAWHELLRIGIANANHSLAWTSARLSAHVARSALNLLRHQIDEGSSCPITMAFAAIPALRVQLELAAEREPDRP